MPTPGGEKWDNRSLFILIWPLVIEQILAVTMGAADTVMVSSVGEYAVSGVNIIDNINNLLIIAFIALSTGGAVVVSQYIGRRDNQKVNMASRQLFYFVIVISVFMMLIALGLRVPIIIFFYGNIGPDVLEAASIYFMITAISYPFLAVYSASAALFRAAGNSKVTMRIAILVNVIHIGLNYVLIYHVKIGIAGAAISTLVSRILAAIILMTLLVKNRRGPLNLEGLLKISINRPILQSILKIGIPSALESSMFQIGRLFTQRLFAPFGTYAMAANAVTSVINSFSFMPGNAFGLALLTVVGQCVGAGDYEGAKRYANKLIKISFIVIFILSLLIYIFMDPLTNLFSLSPEARELTKTFVSVHCITMALAWTFSFALPCALRAAGDARFVMIAAAITMWTVRVSGAYFMVYVVKAGPLSVWLAMGGDMLARGTIYLTRWLSGKWREKKVLSD